MVDKDAAKKRTFEELIADESVFELTDGRLIAIRPMRLKETPAVASMIATVIEQSGTPRVDALVSLLAFTCFNPCPFPPLWARLRRLFRLRDFSRWGILRIVPADDRRKVEEWLVKANLDRTIEEYEASRIAEVKKNLQIAFAGEMERIQILLGGMSPEILEKLHIFFDSAASDSAAHSESSTEKSPK